MFEIIRACFLSFLILLVVAAPTVVYCGCKENWNLLKHLVLSNLVCVFVIWLIAGISSNGKSFFSPSFLPLFYFLYFFFIYMPVFTLVNSIVNFILAEPDGKTAFRIDKVRIIAGVVLNVCVLILLNYVI
jgi:hypothetical protein